MSTSKEADQDIIVISSDEDLVGPSCDKVRDDQDENGKGLVVSAILPSDKRVFTPTKRHSSPISDSSDSEIDESATSSTKRKLFTEFSSSSDEDGEDESCTIQEYYKGDHHLPMYSSLSSGFPVHRLIDIILNPNIAPEKICSVQPLGVMQNAAFLIDIDIVDFDDIKADDLGSWKATGNKKNYFRVTSSGAVKYLTAKPVGSVSTDYLLLTRRYFVHLTYDRFHRLIADVQDHHKQRNKFVMLQYWFDGPPVELQIKPHGNSKGNTPYFRTAQSARKRHREIAAVSTPTETIQLATKESGGELEATGLQRLPRNLDQIKNYRRTGHTKDSNVLYSVMLQCKSSEGSTDAFVRDVKAAPDPQCVLFFNWQLQDLVRFLTNDKLFGIFTADTTYNLGEFYVTPTTYKHLMLADVITQKNPTMAGPILVHQRKNFSSFNYFASTLVCFNKQLQQIKVFGTDGDQALIEAFSHNFSEAKQLRCFIHLKQNIAGKLKDTGMPPSVCQDFLSDVFGKKSSAVVEEGLVDSSSIAEFDARLQNCKEAWLSREKLHGHLSQTSSSFFDQFSLHYADIFRHTTLKCLRREVGLGNPPEIFTTNASESLNAALKRKVNYKETEWPQFNEAVKELISAQRDEVIRALSGRGKYRLVKEYSSFQVTPQNWIKITPDQRKALVQKFDSAKIKTPAFSALPSEPDLPCCSYLYEKSADSVDSASQKMSVSVEDCNLLTLPQATLTAMWDKAEEYLNSNNSVLPAPGSNKKSKMVASRTSIAPHFVTVSSSGQYCCDKNCIQWCSSKICSHTVVSAEVNGELQKFLQWYRDSCQEPNITQLANFGLPAGRGRKGGTAKRKRSRTVVSSNAIVTQRPATLYSSNGQQLIDQQGVTYVTAVRPIRPCAVPQLNDQQARAQVATSQPAMVQQHDQHSAVTPSPSSVNIHNSVQLTQHQSGGSVCVSSHATVSTIQQGCSFVQSNTIQSSNNSYVLPVTGSTDVISAVPNQTLIFQSHDQSFPGVTSTLQFSTQPNTNPFYVKFIVGNMRVCQGCRGNLKRLDGGIPAPPFDLCAARAERRSFRDSNGILITPQKEQPAHYHLNLNCIRAVAPTFVSSSLFVPPDVQPKLNQVHKEYLHLVFNVTVN